MIVELNIFLQTSSNPKSERRLLAPAFSCFYSNAIYRKAAAYCSSNLLLKAEETL
jgi:hypothetical protein